MNSKTVLKAMVVLLGGLAIFQVGLFALQVFLFSVGEAYSGNLIVNFCGMMTSVALFFVIKYEDED